MSNVANVAKVACATGGDLRVRASLTCHGTCVRWPVVNGAWRLGMLSRDNARRWGALEAVGWGAGRSERLTMTMTMTTFLRQTCMSVADTAVSAGT